MADPRSTQILDNVVTTISAITAGATYSQTVRVCKRLTYMAQELSEFCAVFIYDTGVTKDYLASTITNCQQSIMLDCWIQDDDTADAIDQLAADVEKALSVDISRNDLAYDTKIQAVRKFISEDMQPEGNCEIDVLINYRHVEGDPYTGI